MARVSDAHLEARRKSILAAATKVFAQKGIAAATMAEIASEAGISPGAIYRYFETKEELARGCMTESAEAIKAAWENPEAVEATFEDLARLTFEGLNEPEECVGTQMFLEQALRAVRLEDHAGLANFREEHERVTRGIRYLLTRDYGHDLGELDAERLGQALYAFYWGTRMVKMMMPETDPPAQLAEVQKVIQLALRAGIR